MNHTSAGSQSARLMRELMVATISEQPDIEIVGEVQDEPSWRALWRKRGRTFDRGTREIQSLAASLPLDLQSYPQMKSLPCLQTATVPCSIGRR